MGQKNFGHGHISLIIGIILIFIGVILLLNFFASDWVAWTLIGIGAVLCFVGAGSFGVHAAKDGEQLPDPEDKEKADKEKAAKATTTTTTVTTPVVTPTGEL